MTWVHYIRPLLAVKPVKEMKLAKTCYWLAVKTLTGLSAKFILDLTAKCLTNQLLQLLSPWL